MNIIEENLENIRQQIGKAAKGQAIDPNSVNLVAVSKTFPAQLIEDAIKAGCKVFGENRVEETKEKWPALKEKYQDVTLHLIGHLQSKKVKDAVQIFDVIQTLDSEKLAQSLAKEMKKQDKYPEIFVQINIGEEEQKSGISPLEADDFIKLAIEKYQLPVTGVMCIPPQGEEPAPYFALLKNIAKNNRLKNISMGMSADYETAIELGANYVRIGSAIFGERG
ncbi:MAG: YggS family pyridoxal phosphate-dependent enzyme [Proteobacteria bacterium]|nr:YggS family pyridoxal phosphate-dependent enzyme [Pseudomonadota bacterium]